MGSRIHESASRGGHLALPCPHSSTIEAIAPLEEEFGNTVVANL